VTILRAQNSNHKRAPRSIDWQALNLFTEIPKLASLKQTGFLTVHFIKVFAQSLSMGKLGVCIWLFFIPIQYDQAW
jgi:hypothetical protein